MNIISVLTYWLSLPYMRWDILFIFVPTLLLWGFGWKYFLHYKKTILLIAIGSFLWGLLLDILATPVFHIYFYNPYKNVGIAWMGIPLEEFFFLLFVPQAVTCIALLIRKVLYGKIRI